MQRILYYIFIYNILFEGVFEGKKPPTTSLLRGREEETKRHFQSANLGGYKKGNAERRGLFGETAPKSGQMRKGKVGRENRHNMPDDIWTDADNRGRKRQII